jgi:hypothetical protein
MQNDGYYAVTVYSTPEAGNGLIFESQPVTKGFNGSRRQSALAASSLALTFHSRLQWPGAEPQHRAPVFSSQPEGQA